MTFHKTWLHNMWSFPFGSIYIISFDLFESIHLIVRSMLEILIFQFDELVIGFLDIIHFILHNVAFPFS